MARENEAGAQHLIAYVTTQPNASLDPATLRQCLARELPEVMVPAIISILPAMPLTPNGKVDRGALPVPRSSVPVTSAPPGNDIERRIAAIWAELLGLSNVGISDNFFDLGGHSLLVVQVQRRLKEDIGREIAITDMFRYATIQSLAAHIAGVATDRTVEKGLDRANVRKAMIMRRQKSPVQVG
jgi:acyl carrier protein